jgi:hypothetical protein
MELSISLLPFLVDFRESSSLLTAFFGSDITGSGKITWETYLNSRSMFSNSRVPGEGLF